MAYFTLCSIIILDNSLCAAAEVTQITVISSKSASVQIFQKDEFPRNIWTPIFVDSVFSAESCAIICIQVSFLLIRSKFRHEKLQFNVLISFLYLKGTKLLHQL